MTDIIATGQGILYMKVGVHAKEDLSSIIARKTKEIDEAGFALWGYGGNTCHPTTMVQPFARKQFDLGNKVYLCMQEMNSKHFAEQVRAKQFSIDGAVYTDIPPEINVLGSRLALAIKALHKQEFRLDLSQTMVSVGNSKGRPGDKYILGRVDKACLEIAHTEPVEEHPAPATSIKQISLVAELCEPYAVFLR